MSRDPSPLPTGLLVAVGVMAVIGLLGLGVVAVRLRARMDGEAVAVATATPPTVEPYLAVRSVGDEGLLLSRLARIHDSYSGALEVDGERGFFLSLDGGLREFPVAGPYLGHGGERFFSLTEDGGVAAHEVDGGATEIAWPLSPHGESVHDGLCVFGARGGVVSCSYGVWSVGSAKVFPLPFEPHAVVEFGDGAVVSDVLGESVAFLDGKGVKVEAVASDELWFASGDEVVFLDGPEIIRVDASARRMLGKGTLSQEDERLEWQPLAEDPGFDPLPEVGLSMRLDGGACEVHATDLAFRQRLIASVDCENGSAVVEARWAGAGVVQLHADEGDRLVLADGGASARLDLESRVACDPDRCLTVGVNGLPRLFDARTLAPLPTPPVWTSRGSGAADAYRFGESFVLVSPYCGELRILGDADAGAQLVRVEGFPLCPGVY